MAKQDADFNFEKNLGSFYSVDNHNFSTKKQYSPVSVSNGLAWNSQGNTMYYIDSFSYQVWAFDFNLKDGVISMYDSQYRPNRTRNDSCGEF